MAILTRQHNGKKQFRYKVYYKDNNGDLKQKASKWYDSKKQCKEDEALFNLKKKDYADNHVKFYTVAKDYIDFTSDRNVKKTTQDKIHILDTYFNDIKNKRIDVITPNMVRALLQDPKIQSLSTERKNKIYNVLKATFSHAQMFYGLKDNPMRSIPRFQKTSEERLKEMNIYTPEQFNTFYDAVSKSKQEYAEFFFVLYWTGMRKNELRSLTFSCYNGKSVHVWRQLDNTNNFYTLKTKGSTRKIALDKRTRNVIENQIKRYQDMPGFSEDWFIFGGYEPLPKTNIDREKQKALKAGKLPYIRIHDFRHSHASYLIEKGVNMYKISKRLGHSSIEMTMNRYGHLLDVEEDEITSAIEDNFKK